MLLVNVPKWRKTSSRRRCIFRIWDAVHQRTISPTVHRPSLASKKIFAYGTPLHWPQLNNRSPQFTQEDKDFLITYESSIDGLGGLRNPLHLALAISPLCLLVPKVISKKALNRKTLLEVSLHICKCLSFLNVDHRCLLPLVTKSLSDYSKLKN